MKPIRFPFFGKFSIWPVAPSLAKPNAKAALAALLLSVVCLRGFAQAPLVYTSENTGAASCAAPPLPAFSQLPSIAPLPDPFMWADGHGRSTNFSDWECRRNEIKAQIENYEIGKKPARPQNITASYTPGTTAGTGTLTVNVTVNGKTATLTSPVTLPTGAGPYAAMIGMNSPTGSVPAAVFAGRNVATIQYNHNQVTTYYNPQLTDPFYQLYPDQNLSNSGQYAAWSWGVSRLIDGLELVQASLPIDLKHIGVTGCSYAGKMALFAGALDERIALTIAQESGGGGAPAWRVSETLGAVEKLGATDYSWFKDDMKQFADANVTKLPEDHHELMAMVAPRALLVTGNTDFEWLANPAAYVSARATHEVYKTFGLGDRFGFYIDGGHNHCAVPTAQIPVMQAFVDKFLLGNTSANTNVTTNPYPTLDYQRWYKWWGTATPILPPLPAEPLGKRLWLETECATVGSSWDIVADTSAAHGAYAKVKSGLSSTAAAPTGAASYLVTPFNVDSAATYSLLARLSVPAGEDFSYWLKIDNGAFQAVSNQLVSNGGFESGLTGWTTLNSNGATISADNVAADAHTGSGSLKVVNPTAQPGNQWKVQVTSATFPTTIGKQYTISYWVRAAAAGGSIRLSSGPSSAQYQADQAIGTAWQQVSWTITASLASTTFLFDMGQVANTYYIDDASVKEVSADGWRWVKLNSAALSVGAHTLTIGYGSGGNAKLDKLLFTTYTGTITGKGGDADNCKTQQTINFGALPTKLIGDPNLALAATASSGLPVTYVSSDTTIATVTNNMVRLRKVGTVTITAKQTGSATYAAAPVVSQTLTVAPLQVTVQYLDGDNDAQRATNNTINPVLNLVSANAAPVAYSELTARYWLTDENQTSAGPNTWVDWAQMGTSNVRVRYVPLATPRAGAYGYIEYSFAGGTLPANGSSGGIYSRFANSDWSDLNEADDYSHLDATAFVANSAITLYRNGLLVWGTEPATAPAAVAFQVLTESRSWSPTSNSLATNIVLRNTGNQPVSYADVKLRYWFTADGPATLQSWMDYAKLGNANITGQVTRLATALSGADAYLEMSFSPALGTFYPMSTTGDMMGRVTKADWSNFQEANDYSYRPAGPLAENNRVTVYYQGKLVYGTEPTATTAARLASTSSSATVTAATMQVAVLGNPVVGNQAEVEINGVPGEAVQLVLLDFQGNVVSTKAVAAAVDGQKQVLDMPSYMGVYLLKVISTSQTSVVRLLKQ